MEEKPLSCLARVVGLWVMIIITNLSLTARNNNLTFIKVEDDNKRWIRSVATSGYFLWNESAVL
jgi:hypothetical protein